MRGVWQDVRYAVRGLGRQRGYTALALLVLGVAIGLNTSLFTLFNAIVLRPWPVPDASRVVRVFSTPADGSGPRYRGLPVPEQRYLSEQAKTFSGLVALRESVGPYGSAFRVQHVSANFFDVLDVPMELGRAFRADEDEPNAPAAVAVVSYRAWRQHLDGAGDVLGRTLALNEVPFTIIGIASRTFTGTGTTHEDVWIPLSAVSLVQPGNKWERDALTRPDFCCSAVAGRLARGASVEQARAELEHLSRQYHSRFALDPQGIHLTATSVVSNPRERDKILPLSGLLFFALTLLLLLACANVGNLVLARGLSRRHEIAVRLSLGAGRARIVRQLLTESLVLGGAAGALGLGLAYVLPPYLPVVLGANLAATLRPDLVVIAYTAGIVMLACLTFGLAPAFHCTRAAVGRALTERAGSAGPRLSLRGGMLAVQVAVSVVLLAGAGLLVRAVQHASVLDPGFAVHDVAVVSIDVDDRRYDDARKRAFITGLERELTALPGAPAFGFTNIIPLGTHRSRTSVRLPAQDKKEAGSAFVKEVSGGYFDVLKVPVLLGRNFAAADLAQPVVVVSESLARRYWPDGNPLGRALVVGAKALEIVGVVRDARTDDLSHSDATVYTPVGHSFVPHVLIRDGGRTTREALTALAARLDPGARVHVEPLAANIGRPLEPARAGAITAGAIGALGLILATIGLGGVFAYAVQQRTREIGIRMALGARAADVVRLMLRASARAVWVGAGIGVAAAMAASHLLQSYLYGISPLDPLVYAGVAIVLALAVAAASYLPARRAVRVDPTVALRYE